MELRLQGAIEAYERGELTLPEVLEAAERNAPGGSRGSILIATLPGDVHDIGRALLVTLFAASGYTVHDLGAQVPAGTIVDAVRALRPDAIGLSALLVTTSRQMPLCVQQLAAAGLDVPVLIGGAAINRAFGRRSAILPDGRVYAGGVFYCRDVFEGLLSMDALTDPVRRGEFIQHARAEIEAERHQPSPVRTVSPGRSTRIRDIPVPRPTRWGVRRWRPALSDVWRHLDRNTLFRFHWGGYRASPERYAALVRDVFEPRLAELGQQAEGWLQPQIVSGAFPCRADGDTLLIDERARLEFPRQSDGERLCLADYFTGTPDVVVLQAVTVGADAARHVVDLQRQGHYARMLYVNGLASATAEALADFAHTEARSTLRKPADQGLRFSWGYAACPDLTEQRKVLALLDAERSIGLRLTESDNLDPEHSTAALIVHHPDVKYFSVRQRGDA
jgi:5-methyltetrahydrofolate--homocysteine methyltransferase